MTSASVLSEAADRLGQFLPRLAGALLLLVVGLLVAALLGRLVRGALSRIGLDRVSERWGVVSTLERAGLGGSPSRLAGLTLRVALSVVVVFAAVSLLGLEFLSTSLNEGILFIPNLVTAALLVLAGVIVGALARERLDGWSEQLDLPIPLGIVVQVVAIVLFGLTAAAQLGVALAPLLGLVQLLLAAAVLTVTIAFGLGGREVARALSSGRYARVDFSVGQTIEVDGLRGRIVDIGAAATTLEGEHGRARIPNHVLVEHVVIVVTDAGEA